MHNFAFSISFIRKGLRGFSELNEMCSSTKTLSYLAKTVKEYSEILLRMLKGFSSFVPWKVFRWVQDNTLCLQESALPPCSGIVVINTSRWWSWILVAMWHDINKDMAAGRSKYVECLCWTENSHTHNWLHEYVVLNIK